MVGIKTIKEKDMIYLDNAGTTQTDKKVLDAMMPYLYENYGNASSLYTIGQKQREVVENSRKIVAECINAEPREIYFTSGGSESDNQAIISASIIGAKKNKKHKENVGFCQVCHCG